MTRRFATFAFLAFVPALLVAGDVKTDYSHHADFAKYHTYSWIKVQAQDQLWDSRIKRDVDAQLSAKGWQEVPSGGDVGVSAYGSTKNEQSMQTFYDGFGGGWGWGGFGDDGMSTTTTQNIPVGRLMVDIFDGSSKKLIWRSSADNTLSGNAGK
ncbi:MAG: DUF4136 domain-containing protein, partial [Acidobacteriota bacterium]|nr:DUF4136 domain-containing protein [Acidobacteriota bacterium]